MRILIAVADHESRQVLREIICQLDRRIIIETALSARQLFRKLKDWSLSAPSALIILEFGFPGCNALAVLERIRYFRYSPLPAVVVWGDRPSPDSAECCYRWGAKKYLSRDLPPSALKQHLREILLIQNTQSL